MRYLATCCLALSLMVIVSPSIIEMALNAPGHSVCLAAAVLSADEETKPEPKKSDEDVPKIVKSKHERRIERRDNWIGGLEGDKARIFELYGYPSGRYREEVMGTVIERWVYPDQGVTFKFKGNTLIR
jgi:hypothetical protein